MVKVVRRSIKACALALVVALVPSTAAAAPSVGVADSLETVRPEASFSGPPAAAISAAQNEFESFQVVVAAGPEAVEGLEVSLAEPLTGSDGTIPAANVVIYREAYIDLERQSDLEGDTGRWPDALIPAVDPYFGEARDAFPVDVPGDETRVAWIDVLVPAGQPAGTYEGALSVTASGGFSTRVPVELEVRDFGLPSTSTLESAFGAYNICEQHIGHYCARDERGWALQSLYARAALENRVTISTSAYQAPAPEQAEAFTQHLLPLFQGASPENDAGSLLPVRLPGAQLTSVDIDSGRAFVDDWKREASAGGFRDRAFLYACDEPSENEELWRTCKRRARNGHPGWPALDVLITATIDSATRFGAAKLIDILVPLVNDMHDKPGSPRAGDQRSLYDDFLALPGKRLWIYNACPSHGCSGDRGGDDPYWAGWPSYVIDQPASEHRAMGVIAYEYGATGELYFDMTHDLATAWRDQRSFGGNGDGTLFYPGRPERIGGTHDIPVESIRLKRIRDGREDYEYLRLLEAAGGGEEAMAIARALFPTMYETDVSPAAFRAARDELAAAIDGA